MKVYLTSTMAECIETSAKIIKPYNSFASKPCYLFCEDKTTLNMEYEIASKKGGFFGVEVLTFKRYIKLNGKKADILSQEASVMLIRKILNELDKELKCFNISVYRPNLALNVYETISQLESAKVTPEILNSLINEDKISLALKNKISDLSLIYDKYGKYLSDNKYLDSNGYLSLTSSVIAEDENIKNAQVILSGYNSLTKQRADIIDALNKVTNDLSIVIIANENSEIYTNEMLNKLKEIYGNLEVIPSKNILNKEAEFIKGVLYNPNTFKSTFKPLATKNVTVYEAVSPTTEVGLIAKEILLEIRNGKRYKNVAVAVGDLKLYSPIIEKVFSEYNIPYYIDKPTTLLEHPISSHILNYLDLVKKGFGVNEFLRFTSSALINTDKEVLDGLQNYVLKNALTRKNIKEPFTYEDKNLEKYEEIRNLVYSCYQKGEKAKSVNDFTFSINYMLEKTKAYENLNNLGEFMLGMGEHKIKEINDKIPEKIENIFSEMALVLGDSNISALDFKGIFVSGVTGAEIEVIPLFNDAVFVGTASDVKIKNVDILYFMGLNGDIPNSKSDTAFLNDTDLLKLDEFKVIVEPKIKIVNKRERENVGTALLGFNEKLILSYSANSVSGDEIVKSEIVSYILKAFALKAIKESSLNRLKINNAGEYTEKLLSGFASEKTALKEIMTKANGFNLENVETRNIVSIYYQAIEDLGFNEYKDNADNLFDSVGKEKQLHLESDGYFLDKHTSASALESYFKCPYYAYANNLLKLKEVENGNLKVYETGSALHSIIENYVKNIDKVSDEKSSNVLVEELFSNLLQEENYSRYLNKPLYKYTFNNLEKEGKRVCYEVYKTLNNSKFKPFKEELEFSENAEYKPIILNTNNGEYKIRGKIDRVDKYENNIRIIDYKTGKIDSSDSKFYTGRKLQLYLYLNVFSDKGFNPAGSYYFPVHNKFTDSQDKNYVMRGKTVWEEDIISATDVNFKENGGSDIVSIKLKKDGKPTAHAEVLSKEEMNSYLKYAIKVSENAVNEINSGFIKASPYKDECEYCSYGGMCGFCKDVDVERNVTGVNKKTILNAIENNVDGGNNDEQK